MAWLTRDAEVLAVIEAEPGRWGLGRRPPFEGALLLRPPAVVHTLRWPIALDVAWCAARDEARRDPAGGSGPALEVHRIGTVRPRRIAKPCLPGATMVVAPAGAFERWHLEVGDRLQVNGR